MKNLKPIIFFALSFFLSSCAMHTRLLTEQYIKTEIEKHTKNEFSTISTYSIYKSNASYSYYLEFTGYKYIDSKGLVIGADKYYLARQKFSGDMTKLAKVTYIVLTVDECKSILDNYKILLQKVKDVHPTGSKEVYHDYTVNEDLFISYRKSSSSTGSDVINFWIKGDKYSIYTNSMVKKLNAFMSF